MKSTENQERIYNVLVYGFERKGLPVPTEPLRTRNYSLFFEPYGTTRRFQEYDAVILFQGLFETFERHNNYAGSYLGHKFDPDELDKRKKEAALLLGKGGFLCYLLTHRFVDHEDGRDFSRTDLVKYQLSYSGFYRENFASRHAHPAPVLDEFKRFLEMFGAANSYFTCHDDSLDFRPLATAGGRTVGFLLNRGEYFVPSLIPDSRDEVVEEYLELLVDAVIAVHNKLHETLPGWIASYNFEEEDSLSAGKSDLLLKIAEIDRRLQELSKFKAALFHSGSELVADVSAILHAALGTRVDATDDLQEDIKLLDDDGKVIAVCEVKGINRGVGRENINQTDSHRDRSGYDENFPAILVANTNIKNARSIAEKDQEIDGQQIRHAVNMRILVTRTIDLLGVLRLVLAGKLSQQDARGLFLENVGWLRVAGDEISVLNGQ
ncbi:hypothetical protein [Caballeronia sp. NCTM5]|uniref:hypothetical protein n=1 Tax=Caballeronia sp. NCTM5 TaxID=2921755 RepID=UPI002027BA83|nr:hypothetical protein [Caballeronia sp. NCTM5]